MKENNLLQPHIRCGIKDSAKYALLPGDPKGIDRIKEFLTDTKEISYNREHRSISGYYKGIKIIAVSTGMGGASTGIVVEELYNIGVEVMIRIGSCGALDSNINLGDIILVNGAVRDEGASKAYIESIYPAIPDFDVLLSTCEAAKEKKYRYFIGKARSHDSFYTDEEETIDEYWSSKGILGADMETAALFTIGALRGVKTASILNNVSEYKKDLKDEVNNYVEGENLAIDGEKREIIVALEAIVKLNNKFLK
ncbi:MAG: nucleoside phosphorylase [Clostridium neonatale]